MPTSKGGGARFRGPTSSHEYNMNEDTKYYELVELYRQSNDNRNKLREAYEVILAEHAALQSYVSMLENRLLTLEEQIKSLEGDNQFNGRFFKTAFVDDMTTTYPTKTQDDNVKTPRCTIDLQYRFATIPLIHQIPKTHAIGKDQKPVIPDDLVISVGRSNTGGTVIENDIKNAFNGDNESYWKRQVIYPFANAPDEEDVILEIQLPLKLVNNLNINTILIHPHPERGIQIKNVEIHYNNAWEQIKGFEQNEISVVPSNEFSPRKKWYFPNKPVQKVRITLVQKNPLDIDGNRVFVLGAQEIGIYLSIFEPSGGFVLTPFDMSDVGVYNIESIEHVFLNRKAFSYPDNLDNLLEGNIYHYEVLIEQNGILTPISNSNWNNQTARKIWVKTHLYPDPEPSSGVNPCLHAVRLHYTRN
jgi:hypothetical protein